MIRQVFFSFEYDKDNWRAAQVRNMGKVDQSSTFVGNDWEEVRRKDDASIKRWIINQMQMRSCVVVLIGQTTSTRKWVKFEIEEAYRQGKGLVGIYIDRLEDKNQQQSLRGQNPFEYVYAKDGSMLSKYVTCFESTYLSSSYAYREIADNMELLIENAIKQRGTY